MIKTYKSNSDIAINVKVGKNNAHVTFMPVTGGGSVYSTSDEKLQEAMAKHHRFNELFVLIESEDEEKENKSKKGVPKGGKAEKGAEGAQGDGGFQKVEIASIDDAVEFLAEKGVSRTKLKSLDSIKENASSLKIEFTGLE